MIEIADFSIQLTEYGYLCFGIVSDGIRVESISFFKGSIKDCVREFEAEVTVRFKVPYTMDKEPDTFSKN